MHPILLYLLKMLLCSGILYGYYRVALYNERFHQWNRFFLLATVLLSLVLPLVEIPLPGNTKATPIVTVMDILPWNNTVPDTAPSMQASRDAPMLWIALLAGMVSLVLLIKLSVNLGKIFRNYRRGDKFHLDAVQIILTQDTSAPYSFFHWLFWRDDLDVHSSTGKRMLQHELTHIRQKHSLDKCLMESLLIIGWMNPFFWLIRKEIYMIHEFLADKNAIDQHNGGAFAEMILQSMHIQSVPALANPFFTSQIKRRLFMITSSNTHKYSYVKRITTLLIGATTILLIACTTEKKEDVSGPVPIMVVEGFPLPDGFNRFAVKDITNPDLPEGTLIYLDGNPNTLAAQKNENPELIEYDVLMDKEAALKKNGEKATAGAYELYSFPTAADGGQPGKEDLPSFPGGKEGWRQYLQSNLRYPDSAIDKGTMGVVKIACSIMPDGTLAEAIIVENPGYGLGEEALRILTTGPKWIPAKMNGTATGRRIVVPITFRLE